MTQFSSDNDLHPVCIHTDGSCLGNPGPGGWAAILSHKNARKEIAGGFALTTNNRMEILAVIEALRCLKQACEVDLYTDSQYVANAIRQNWLKNWQKNGWRTAAKKPVKNRDLWETMAELLTRHTVRFHWLKGHAGHPENERCDELARAEALKTNLPRDPGFQA